MNNEVTIVFTVAEFDYVMNALAQRPFAEVNGFLAKLVNQANSQGATKVSSNHPVASGVVEAGAPGVTEAPNG